MPSGAPSTTTTGRRCTSSIREDAFASIISERASTNSLRRPSSVCSPNRDAGSRNGEVVSLEAAGVEAPADWANLRSPENYVGYQRTEHFASPGGIDRDRRRLYAVPARLALNQWAVAAEWTMGPKAAVLNSPAGRIACRFHARDLHLVMGPSRRESQVRFRVSIDCQQPALAHGVDVDSGGNGTVVEQRLYQLVRQSRPIAERSRSSFSMLAWRYSRSRSAEAWPSWASWCSAVQLCERLVGQFDLRCRKVLTQVGQ